MAGLLARKGRRRKSTELPIGDGTSKRRRMLLIVNPFASTVSHKLKNVVIYALQSRYDVEAVETEDRNHATDICRRAVEHEHEIVVSFGGDGTANEVANGMAGTDIPVAFLPGGMTSVIARNIGMPVDPIDATEHLLSLADRWKPRKVDLGDANGRKFLFGAGVGFDAAVVRACEQRPRLKQRFRENFYYVTAMRVLTSDYLMRKPRMTTTCDDLEVEAVVTIVQNSAPFTYFGDRPLHICEHADLNSGKLSLAALDRVNPFDFPPLYTRLMSRRLSVADNRHLHVVDEFDEAIVRAKDGRVPLQVDGDYVGEYAEIRFRPLPGALTIIA